MSDNNPASDAPSEPPLDQPTSGREGGLLFDELAEGETAEEAAAWNTAFVANLEALGTAWGRFREVAAEIGRALDPALKVAAALAEVLPRIDWHLAAERLTSYLPPNWPEKPMFSSRYLPISRDDGIPIVWVPRSDIVSGLLDCSDRASCLKLLRERQVDILEDCRRCVAESTHPQLGEVQVLAGQALEAFTSGLMAPSQALAVILCESLIADHVVPSGSRSVYAAAKEEALVDEHVTIVAMRRAFALAPIDRFFTGWFRTSPGPSPTELSRHLSVHLPSLQQYSPENSLIAVMLLASLLREIHQELTDTAPTSNSAQNSAGVAP
jgi:hypothetical protein